MHPVNALWQDIALRYNRIQMLSQADYVLLADFRYYIRRFLHFSEQSARAAEIEPQQHQLLLALRAQPEGQAPIRVLAERLQIQHNTAVELIDRLARRGYVRRTRAETDRRQVLVAISARGEAKLAKLSKSHLEELRRAGPSLVASLESLMSRSHARS